MNLKTKIRLPLWSMFLVLFILINLCLLIGRYRISFLDIINLILGNSLQGDRVTIANILINIRLPRVLGAVLVGSSLSVAGASYQGIFKNPMVSPSLLGVSSGAGFGAALAIVMKLSSFMIQISAFIFGLLAVIIVYSMGNLVSKSNSKMLSIVLIGIVTSSLFSALISLIKYIGDPLDDLPAITFWLMGSLSGVMLKDIFIISIPVILGIAGIWAIKWRLNIMSLSDEEAMSLGLAINKIRLINVVCSTLITASVVSISGIIGWVGLVIPHLVRMCVGNNYKYVIPASIAFGAIYMLIIDAISRSLFSTEIPLGILTAIIGTPIFVSIMLTSKKINR